jgi:NADPH2:quinone reductase
VESVIESPSVKNTRLFILSLTVIIEEAHNRENHTNHINGKGARVSGTDPQRRGDEGVDTDAVVVTAGIIDAPGALPRVGSITLPSRPTGCTLLEVIAAPLNPLDLLIASGHFHSARHEQPYVPGSECVGTVIESDSLAAGTRVYAECPVSPSSPGAFATHVVVSDENMLALPDGVDAIMASAIGNSGTAAFLPLVDRAGLRAGDVVLVLGATGAVGQLAVQIAKHHGAAKVIGVARDQAALERLGADAVVALRADESAEELAARLSLVTGPVNIVLDGLYGLPIEAALRVCAPHARVINIGNLAGATAEVPAGVLRAKQISLSGFAGLHTPLRDKAVALNWLWNASAGGDLRIEIRTFSLDQLPAAWSEQSNSPHAKCVILPGNGASGS